jgi:ABC-2 type transport system permease protein
LLFFISGYAIYASLMAGLGALVPDIKSGTQASIIVISPLLIGYVVSVFPPVQEAPHGLLATVLSIFPFTAPPVMMMRLTVGGVPLWQLLLAIGLSIITVIIVVRAVAGMFHAQTMLSGQPFSPRRYFSALFGRV